MVKLSDYRSYADALQYFSGEALWDLFDGTRDRINIAHECIDRYAAGEDGKRPALQIADADGTNEIISFAEISRKSSQVAHYILQNGVVTGDRVAVMLEPSLAYYAAMFGIIKAGAVAVPMFTAFGPDGIRLRVDDCTPKILFTNQEKCADAEAAGGAEVIVADEAFLREIDTLPAEFEWNTSSNDLAVLQYTSGTTRLLPAAVQHNHRSIVTLMVAALYATGIRRDHRHVCWQV